MIRIYSNTSMFIWYINWHSVQMNKTYQVTFHISSSYILLYVEGEKVNAMK